MTVDQQVWHRHVDQIWECLFKNNVGTTLSDNEIIPVVEDLLLPSSQVSESTYPPSSCEANKRSASDSRQYPLCTCKLLDCPSDYSGL